VYVQRRPETTSYTPQRTYVLNGRRDVNTQTKSTTKLWN